MAARPTVLMSLEIVMFEMTPAERRGVAYKFKYSSMYFVLES